MLLILGNNKYGDIPERIITNGMLVKIARQLKCSKQKRLLFGGEKNQNPLFKQVLSWMFVV